MLQAKNLPNKTSQCLSGSFQQSRIHIGQQVEVAEINNIMDK